MPIHAILQLSRLRLAALALALALPAFARADPAAAPAAAPEAAKPAVETPKPAADTHSQTFAVVNGRNIATQEYENAFMSLVRQRFYHGQIPEKELAAAREEVKFRLVQRVVLLEEAGRRGILADGKQIDDTLAGYDQRYAGSPAWRENRERLLPGLKLQLEEQSQVAQLEQQVKAVADPGHDEVRAFYDARRELFTEPEKLRLSVILLAVDPSSPATAWEATREEAKAVYQRLLAGADFAETARLHSSSHAEASGDMGYLHRGMLPEALQERIDKYEQGKANEPVETLQGMAIFRLDDRLPPRQREFADVAQRARELLLRERQEQAWKSLVDRLVAAADVKFLTAMKSEPREGSGQ